MIRGFNMDGLMGMREMEHAVALMMEKAKSKGIEFHDLVVYPEEFAKEHMSELVGFAHLCLNGWMESRYPNCNFSPNQKLTERVTERFPEFGGKGPSLLERLDSRFPSLGAGVKGNSARLLPDEANGSILMERFEKRFPPNDSKTGEV